MNINELTEARTRLINEKSGIVAQLAEVNSTLKATLPIKQYQAATQARVNLVSRLSKIEIEIGELNISIRGLHRLGELRLHRADHRSVVIGPESPWCGG